MAAIAPYVAPTLKLAPGEFTEIIPGTYRISNLKTSTCIEVNDVNNKVVECWDYMTAGQANQQWYVRHAPGGGFTIANVKLPNQYLAAPKPPKNWNDWIELSTEAFRWKIHYAPDGRFNFPKFAIIPFEGDQNHHLDLYKGSAANGTQMSLSQNYTYDNQRWRLFPSLPKFRLNDPELEFQKALEQCQKSTKDLEGKAREADALRNELAAAQAHDAELEKELSAAHKHSGEVEVELAAVKLRNAELEKDILAAKSHDEEDEKRLKEAKEHDVEDEKKLAASKQRVDDLEKQLAAAKKKDQEDQKKLADAAKHDEADEKKLADSKKNVEDLQKQLATAKKHDEDDEKQLALTKKRLEAVEKSLIDAKKHDTEDEKMINALKTELTATKDNVTVLKKQLTASQAQVNKLETDLTYWKRRELDARKDGAYWKLCYEAVKKEIEAFHARIHSLRHWFSHISGGPQIEGDAQLDTKEKVDLPPVVNGTHVA